MGSGGASARSNFLFDSRDISLKRINPHAEFCLFYSLNRGKHHAKSPLHLLAHIRKSDIYFFV